MVKENINNSSQQELLSCCFCYHVSPNIIMLGLLLCYLRVPSQLASPWGFHFNTHPEGEPCAFICVCLRHFRLRRPHAKKRSTSCCIQITIGITPTLECARGHGDGRGVTLILQL